MSGEYVTMPPGTATAEGQRLAHAMEADLNKAIAHARNHPSQMISMDLAIAYKLIELGWRK